MQWRLQLGCHNCAMRCVSSQPSAMSRGQQILHERHSVSSSHDQKIAMLQQASHQRARAQESEEASADHHGTRAALMMACS